MPTGYTDRVRSGDMTTFPEFAMSCARAFGANIMLRDEPSSTPIPEQYELGQYYVDRVPEAEKRLAELRQRTESEWAAAYVLATADEANAEKAEFAKQSEERARYERMLADVRAWKPPSEEHTQFKEFMIEQLESSIKFDCGGVGDWYWNVRRQGLTEFMIAEVARAKKDLERARESLADEQDRVAGRNRWNRLLRESLAGA